jgi:hypothetical protein
MPGATLHLTHVDLLGSDPAAAPLLGQAMARQPVAARLGGLVIDLPFYTSFPRMMLGYWLQMPAEHCAYGAQLHSHHPGRLAWRFVCRAARENGLPRDQRLALLGGFLAHAALDQELHPLINWCAQRDLERHGGHESHHHRLAEKYQSLFFHQELLGGDPIGTPELYRRRSLILRRPSLIWPREGDPALRWLADLLALHLPGWGPGPRQLALRVRAFRQFILAVSAPWARVNSRNKATAENRLRYYDNPDFAFFDHWRRGYRRSLELLDLAARVLREGDLSEGSRRAFLRRASITDLASPPAPSLPPFRGA